MAAKAQLPGALGHAQQTHQSRRYPGWMIAAVLVAIIGTPASAWARSSSRVPRVQIIALASASEDALAALRPESGDPYARAAPGASALSDDRPPPLLPPPGRPADTARSSWDLPAPMAGVSPAQVLAARVLAARVLAARVLAEARVPNRTPRSAAHQVTAPSAARAHHGSAARTPITADRRRRAMAEAIASDRRNQSLVYSGILALAIAGIGLIMLGFRRRLW